MQFLKTPDDPPRKRKALEALVKWLDNHGIGADHAPLAYSKLNNGPYLVDGKVLRHAHGVELDAWAFLGIEKTNLKPPIEEPKEDVFTSTEPEPEPELKKPTPKKSSSSKKSTKK